ncbi:uncharacterized protein LOC134215559 isoform X2 [Armigeres subalbatus]|uniref:uncharacterized protein LOC134215559 isoform X2 n=1 Tax=Armigeres subalbatus TaxID=124917 RepID=UPI002ED18BFF
MSRWSEDKSLVFVQHYEKYRSLWDPSYKDYRNRDIRNQAIKLLSTDMECSGITMTTDDVKNRIKSIRTTYAAEKRKIEKSKKSGSSSDDIYQPSCSWYEVADRFLRKSATIRPVFENLDLNSQISSPMMSTSYQDHIDSGPEENEGNCSTQNQTGYVSSKINNKKKRRQNPTIEAVNKLEKIYESSRTDLTEDEYDIFGKYIAANLRKLSVLRALDAQEKINAILLNARKLELTTPSSMNQTTRRKDRFSFDCSGVLNDHAAPLYETQPSTQSSIVLNDHSAPLYETQPNTQSSKVLTDHAVVLYGTQQNIQSSKAIQDHAAIYGTQSSKPVQEVRHQTY